MGNLATTMSRKMSRPMKNFAVEARAKKVISRDKPLPAPWHPATQRKIDELLKDNPNLADELDKRDASLEERLKSVYVTSHNPTTFTRESLPNKPLPVVKDTVEPPELGYREPTKVTKGKLSIRQALAMIGKYHQNPNPDTNSIMSLANEYTIHPQVAGNILKYFRTFELYQPPESKVKISVKTYMSLESSASNHQLPQLEEGKRAN